MLEAYIAAIFVDSGFDYTVIETFYNRHIKPYFVDMSLYDTFANKHPTVMMKISVISTHFHATNDQIDISIHPVDKPLRLHKLLSEVG